MQSGMYTHTSKTYSTSHWFAPQSTSRCIGVFQKKQISANQRNPNKTPPRSFTYQRYSGRKQIGAGKGVLLMEEIQHHLGCIKPYE